MSRPELIVVMDFPNKNFVDNFMDNFPTSESLYLKVGMELYYKEGPAIVTHLKEKGHRIFLDLKMHDIPNTVKSAMRQVASLGVDLTNIHAVGGRRMMEAAVEGLIAGTPLGRDRPLLIAVTQLTSMSKEVMNNELLIPGEVSDVVESYAKLSKAEGLDGVVCSVHEARRIHEVCGDDFIALTPGIRLEGDDVQDQARVATPKCAAEQGSDYIVVGRSITQADDPYEVYKRVLAEVE